MMLKEEILDLLRTDQAFREEVRRQIMTDDLLALPERFDQLTEAVQELVGTVRELAEAQRRTEQALQRQSEQLQRHDQLIQRNTEQIQALIEAQQRTEQALQRQSEQIEALIQAQQRTEQALQRQSEQIEALIQAQQRTEETLRHLTEAQERTEAAQRRTEETLQQLVNWQRGESGRRDGERYERETIRRAQALLNGGQGGSPEQPWVQQQLTKWLRPLLGDGPFEAETDPFLADLIWWKGEQIAVVEISRQVNGYDVLRAAKRAETFRQVGVQVIPIVIGDDWASEEARYEAVVKHVEWKVGSDLTEGFLAFRRAPSD